MFHRAASSILRKSATTTTIGRRIPTLTTAVGSVGSVRHLNVHEHISMELFNEHGITTPGGAVAFSPEEAKEAYQTMGSRK